jgi:oligopeptide/dipeptide ABC transporter ATP-binding protein
VGKPQRAYQHIRGEQIAMIFQDPMTSLDPLYSAGEQVAEALRFHRKLSHQDATANVVELFEHVGIPLAAKRVRSYPHQLSGGMRQRVMIAMAVSCDPVLLIADEPTTALDVTLQRQILRLLLELRERLGMAILFVSHDLAVVHGISERISVIYCGKIVESGSRERVFARPLHPYTQALLASIPQASRRGTRLRAIPGTVPDASHVPAGCAFHPRCPLAVERCREEVPRLLDYAGNGGTPREAAADRSETGETHLAACHLVGT